MADDAGLLFVIFLAMGVGQVRSFGKHIQNGCVLPERPGLGYLTCVLSHRSTTPAHAKSSCAGDPGSAVGYDVSSLTGLR